MKKPYYSVIFTSTKVSESQEYEEMSKIMEDLAKEQPGFLGLESARGEIGITVSYWESLESIAKWKQHTQHITAQIKGKEDWYNQYSVRIGKVEREYHFYKE
ncbi:MAG: heme-degrading monooxygenase HmoA [Maribacter sp.]|jgi:heme-degrading monooxygenase HmoA